jgi:hypothetical protein
MPLRHVPSAVRLAAAIGMVATAIFAGATTAGAAHRSMGAVPAVSSLSAIACPTPTDCIAVGLDTNSDGKSAVVHSASGTASVWPGTLTFHPLDAVACAVPTACVAVATAATVRVTVASGASSLAGTLHPPTGQIAPLGAVACPNPTECFAVGFEGTEGRSKALLVHLSATGAILGMTLESSRSGFGAIACSTSTLCFLAAANLAHPEMVQLLDNGHLAGGHLLAPKTYIQALACFRNVACYALAGRTNVQRTDLLYPINPSTGAIGSARTIGAGFSGDGIACPNANQCVVVGFNGARKPAVVIATRGAPGAPRAVAGTGLSGIGCTDAGACFGVGQDSAVGLVERV